MNIRQFCPEDLEEVVELWNKAVEAQQSGYEKHKINSKILKDFLQTQNYLPSGVLVAEEKKKILGFVLVYIQKTSDRNTAREEHPARLAGIAVRPDCWQKDIGHKLLESVEKAVKNEGKTEISFHINRQPFRLSPGPYLDTGPHRFFISCGYILHSHAMRLRNNLEAFTLPDYIKNRRRNLNKEGINFKLLEPSERENLLRFMAKYFSGGWYKAIKRTSAGENKADILIVTADRKVIGFMGPFRVNNKTKRGSFGSPGISPEYRGRGIGKTLIYMGFNHLKENGAAFTEYRTGYSRADTSASRAIYFDSGARLVEIFCKYFYKKL